jgi:hypothetical protein
VTGISVGLDSGCSGVSGYGLLVGGFLPALPLF